MSRTQAGHATPLTARNTNLRTGYTNTFRSFTARGKLSYLKQVFIEHTHSLPGVARSHARSRERCARQLARQIRKRPFEIMHTIARRRAPSAIINISIAMPFTESRARQRFLRTQHIDYWRKPRSGFHVANGGKEVGSGPEPTSQSEHRPFAVWDARSCFSKQASSSSQANSICRKLLILLTRRTETNSSPLLRIVEQALFVQVESSLCRPGNKSGGFVAVALTMPFACKVFSVLFADLQRVRA